MFASTRQKSPLLSELERFLLVDTCGFKFYRHLVQSDPQFQAVYDAVLVQAAIFMIYVLVHDFWIAGR